MGLGTESRGALEGITIIFFPVVACNTIILGKTGTPFIESRDHAQSRLPGRRKRRADAFADPDPGMQGKPALGVCEYGHEEISAGGYGTSCLAFMRKTFLNIANHAGKRTFRDRAELTIQYDRSGMWFGLKNIDGETIKQNSFDHFVP